MKEIADHLGVHFKTAENQWTNICYRHGTNNQMTLAAIALQQGLVTIEEMLPSRPSKALAMPERLSLVP